MLQKMKGVVFGLAGLILVMTVLQGTAVGLRSPTEQRTITFSDLEHEGEAFAGGTYSLDTVSSIDDPMVLETKSAELVNLKDGIRSTLNMTSFENGTVTYTFEYSQESLNLKDVEIIPPILYVEEQAKETMVIPLTGDSSLIDLKVEDSKQAFPDAASAVIVEFTASDIATLPYNPTLVSNGETYECGASYYFDAETGAFTHGQLVFVGITVEELAANATLETMRVFNRYVPTSYDLEQ